MQIVKPTGKWQQNILPIPIGNNPPVRLPVNHPRIVSVSDASAEYMVNNGFAVYCNHLGEAIDAPPSTQMAVETPEVKEVKEVKELPEVTEAPEVKEVEELPEVKEVEEVEEVEELPEVKEVEEVEEVKEVEETSDTSKTPEAAIDTEALFEFIGASTAAEISTACRSIRIEKAQKLKEIVDGETPTWSQIEELLTSRQVKALLRAVEG